MNDFNIVKRENGDFSVISNDRLMTAKEAAEVLRVSTRTISYMFASGELPKVKLSPKKVFVTHEDLQKYIESKKSGGIICQSEPKKSKERKRADGSRSRVSVHTVLSKLS